MIEFFYRNWQTICAVAAFVCLAAIYIAAGLACITCKWDNKDWPVD